jgi:hypothetical protein
VTTSDLKTALWTSLAAHSPEGVRVRAALWPIIEAELKKLEAVIAEKDAELNREIEVLADVASDFHDHGCEHCDNRFDDTLGPEHQEFEGSYAHWWLCGECANRRTFAWEAKLKQAQQQLEITLGHLEAALKPVGKMTVKEWVAASNHLKAMREES